MDLLAALGDCRSSFGACFAKNVRETGRSCGLTCAGPRHFRSSRIVIRSDGAHTFKLIRGERVAELAFFSSAIDEFRYVIKRQSEFLFSVVLCGELTLDRLRPNGSPRCSVREMAKLRGPQIRDPRPRLAIFIIHAPALNLLNPRNQVWRHCNTRP